MRTNARTTPEPTALEQTNAALSRRVAGEGIVLLENDNVLPIAVGPIALYGEGAGQTIKGGLGSGEVNARRVVSIREGLEEAGFEIATARWLDDYDRCFDEAEGRYLAAMRKRSGFANFGSLGYLEAHPFPHPSGPLIGAEDLVNGVTTCLYVLARQAGEHADRQVVAGDFLLTETEIANIGACVAHYPNTVVVINAGGMLDLSPLDGLGVKALVYFCQQGAEGGRALADVISGLVNPSGRLSSTWPRSYDDIPFGELLGANAADEDYREGIYVGYRYFDSFAVEPRYPFGYGLSYTPFTLDSAVSLECDEIVTRTVVTNRGRRAGKTVVQVYVSCPSGHLDKEYQRLAGFAKTETLAGGGSEEVTIRIPMASLASYDAEAASFILEPGDYLVRIGEGSRSTEVVGVVGLDQTVVLTNHQRICAQKYPIDEIRPSPSETAQPDRPRLTIAADTFATRTHQYGAVRGDQSDEVKAWLDRLSGRDQADLCVGAGLDMVLPKAYDFVVPGAAAYTTSKFAARGLPAISFCDGPAGLRLYDVSAWRGRKIRMVNPAMAFFFVMPTLLRWLIFTRPRPGRLLYQYATAFPVGTALAQTWNGALIEEVGQAIQAEMEAFGAVVWLAPGMNIHRNPLCGRNFEYFSEDPLLSGKLAAALTRGVQSKPGFLVTLKHFCANNQETNRKYVSANLSERALREIYLRGFQIAVAEGEARALMTSYNRVNGVYADESFDLCTKVLRDEWGFDGLVMTDWISERDLFDPSQAIRAGVNLLMPGQGRQRRQLKRALRSQTFATDLATAASQVLRTITHWPRGGAGGAAAGGAGGGGGGGG
ncbi:MAG: glycoside hydrolase family 3 C-terminal domain-containing protein, partial [Propionibacteriaceae bacterium]|nr:glycoside hydrolase family 3 C-terminal domain-containing protein [Propionibacteriaceae bacterium]